VHVSPGPPASLSRRLTTWYAAAARDLPWRRPGTSAWGVLVSEIMLQQTPVARVLPAYDAWLRRWPTPAALAAEPAGEAVRQWGRLGYPRRALALHSAAVAITGDHGGEVPADLETLLALPGVGAYTARAVAAFAYGQRHPVVDTNVRRVLHRHRLGNGRPPTAATSVADRDQVEQLLPRPSRSAVTTSVALMELGALVCTARQPDCPRCPIAVDCAWRLAGAPAAKPARTQSYEGTDRQARGRLLAVLRDAPGPVPTKSLVDAWPEPVQRERALSGLLADGLVNVVGRDAYALPS
jgi:A/G-specific adenine glycosylase